MAHVAKYRMTAVGHLCNHYTRSENMELSACVVRKNESIDTSRTALNYNLAKCLQPMEQLDFIHRRLSEVKVIPKMEGSTDEEITEAVRVYLQLTYATEPKAFSFMLPDGRIQTNA